MESIEFRLLLLVSRLCNVKPSRGGGGRGGAAPLQQFGGGGGGGGTGGISPRPAGTNTLC